MSYDIEPLVYPEGVKNAPIRGVTRRYLVQLPCGHNEPFVVQVPVSDIVFTLSQDEREEIDKRCQEMVDLAEQGTLSSACSTCGTKHGYNPNKERPSGGADSFLLDGALTATTLRLGEVEYSLQPLDHAQAGRENDWIRLASGWNVPSYMVSPELQAKIRHEDAPTTIPATAGDPEIVIKSTSDYYQLMGTPQWRALSPATKNKLRNRWLNHSPLTRRCQSCWETKQIDQLHCVRWFEDRPAHYECKNGCESINQCVEIPADILGDEIVTLLQQHRGNTNSLIDCEFTIRVTPPVVTTRPSIDHRRWIQHLDSENKSR